MLDKMRNSGSESWGRKKKSSNVLHDIKETLIYLCKFIKPLPHTSQCTSCKDPMTKDTLPALKLLTLYKGKWTSCGVMDYYVEVQHCDGDKRGTPNTAWSSQHNNTLWHLLSPQNLGSTLGNSPQWLERSFSQAQLGRSELD